MTREFLDMLWDASLRMGSPEKAKYDFADLIAAYEREACAKVCADLWCKEPEPGDARDCHDAIRARGEV